MSVWKDPLKELPPVHTDVVVWVQGVFAVASWVPEDGGWICSDFDDTEDADFVDLWTEIPPMDAEGASARQRTGEL